MENDNQNQLPEEEIPNLEQFKVGRAAEEDLDDTDLETTDDVELGFIDDEEPEELTDAPLVEEDDDDDDDAI